MACTMHLSLRYLMGISSQKSRQRFTREKALWQQEAGGEQCKKSKHLGATLQTPSSTFIQQGRPPLARSGKVDGYCTYFPEKVDCI